VPACELVVNVFDGGPRTQVTYEVAGDARELPMQRTASTDPFVADLFGRHPDKIASWMRAEPSSHVWRAPFPEDLGAGAHRITVRARNEYGAEHVGHAVVEVGAPDADTRSS
jgi:hypothetical protein